MQRLQSKLRLRHVSPRAVEAYSAWVTRYVRYCRPVIRGRSVGVRSRGFWRTVTHLLASGYDIRTVQVLLGYRDGSTTMLTMLYTMRSTGEGWRSEAPRTS